MFSWMKNGIPTPESLVSLRDELEKHVKATVQGILSRMDLVTRDELDVQLNVLMRTREKLETLEARLTTLEAKQTPTQPVKEDSTITPPQEEQAIDVAVSTQTIEPQSEQAQ